MNDPSLRLLIDAWKQTRTPSPARIDAAWTATRARIEGGPAMTGAKHPTRIRIARFGIVVALVGAGVGLRAKLADPPRATVEQPEGSNATGTEVAATIAPVAPRSTASLSVPISAVAQHDDLQTAPTPLPAIDGPLAASTAGKRGVRPRPKSPPGRGAAQAPTSERLELEPAAPTAAISLAEELALLRRAREALRHRNAARARDIVVEHRARWPTSAFSEEREATFVMALCALGRRDEAERRAAGFRAQYPDSAFAAGLIDACAAEK